MSVMTLSPSLPPLRADIRLYEGPTNFNGGPTWTLHDPNSNRYFQIGPMEFEIISRWRMRTTHAIADDIKRTTTFEVQPFDIEMVLQFLTDNSLLRIQGVAAVRKVASEAGGRVNWAKWLLHNYLFFKIPLVRPNDFLETTLPAVSWLWSRGAQVLLLLTGLAGIYLVSREWDVFLASFSYFFSLEGLVYSFLTIAAVKVVHELAHAYTAKRFGCHVSTMGVAFLVMWPTLYTDTSDAWRLKDHGKRLKIGGAGMTAELAVAVIATFLWSFFPDGFLRSALFLLATVTWIMTLAINLNPFLRFDGYYLLADLLRVSNLQQRAFALARWRMREALFRFREPAPEPFPPDLHLILLIYAYGTWIFRFFLFLGIAVLVYSVTFKVLGIFLAAVELIWFIGRPVAKELAEWWKRRHKIRVNPNTALVGGVVVILLCLLLIPWQSTITAPGILFAKAHTRLFPPAPARLARMHVREGSMVAKGDILFTLDAPETVHRLRQSERQIELISWELARSATRTERLRQVKVLEEEHAKALAEREALRGIIDNLVLTAPRPGVIFDVPREVAVGQWVNPDQTLGLLADTSAWVVEAYVRERDLGGIAVGQRAKFRFVSSDRSDVPLRVTHIDELATDSLARPFLASEFNGPIPTRRDAANLLVPDETVYRVILSPEISLMEMKRLGRGTVVIDAEVNSVFSQLFEKSIQIFIREFGF